MIAKDFNFSKVSKKYPFTPVEQVALDSARLASLDVIFEAGVQIHQELDVAEVHFLLLVSGAFQVLHLRIPKLHETIMISKTTQ